MTRKQVWRYSCEHCGKSNCSASAVATHEKHCTRNPNRECRMCQQSDNEQTPMSRLIQIANKGDIHALRLEAGNCPMCIWSAIHQCDPKVHADDGWEFSLDDECREFWKKINDAEAEAIEH